MAWDKKLSDFNVIKGLGTKVLKLHYGLTNYQQLTLPQNVTNAIWGGNALTVYLSDGSVRRYTSHDNYSNY